MQTLESIYRDRRPFRSCQWRHRRTTRPITRGQTTRWSCLEPGFQASGGNRTTRGRYNADQSGDTVLLPWRPCSSSKRNLEGTTGHRAGLYKVLPIYDLFKGDSRGIKQTVARVKQTSVVLPSAVIPSVSTSASFVIGTMSYSSLLIQNAWYP
jgi:hypothetical protein